MNDLEKEVYPSQDTNQGKIIQFKTPNRVNEITCQNSNNLKGELEKMANIRKRSSGLFEARISFKGKYFSVYDRDLNKLKVKITKKIKELTKEYKNQKTLALKVKDNYTLKSWYKKWLEEDKKPFISSGTYNNIKIYFETHILKKIGNYKLNSLTKSIIQQYLNGLKKNRTKELITTYLKSCITQAHKERLIEYNPFDNVKVEQRLNIVKGGLTAKEQKTILDFLKTYDNNFYKLILIYLCLGCRRNELLNLEKNQITDNFVYIIGTKTKNSTRYVNITKEFSTFLIKHFDIIKNYKPNYITQKFKNIADNLSIKGGIHSLRHSFATNHYYLGTPAKQVQNWLGHSTIQMTLDIYTNLNPTIDPKQEKNDIKNLYNNLYYYTE